MINYILSLPAKAAAFFTDCVKKFTAILKRGLKQLFAGLADGVDTGGIGEIITAVNEGVAASQELANAGTRLLATVQPATIAAALLSPSSQAEVDAAGVAMRKLISDAGPINSPLDVGQGP